MWDIHFHWLAGTRNRSRGFRSLNSLTVERRWLPKLRRGPGLSRIVTFLNLDGYNIGGIVHGTGDMKAGGRMSVVRTGHSTSPPSAPSPASSMRRGFNFFGGQIRSIRGALLDGPTSRTTPRPSPSADETESFTRHVEIPGEVTQEPGKFREPGGRRESRHNELRHTKPRRDNKQRHIENRHQEPQRRGD